MNARYGNVFAFSVPWRKYVFINEPALIKEVFVTQQQAFTKSLGARSLRFLLGDGLLTSEEPKHRQMRRIVQPAFHRERIANYAEIMERAAGEFVARFASGILLRRVCGDDGADAAHRHDDAVRQRRKRFDARGQRSARADDGRISARARSAAGTCASVCRCRRRSASIRRARSWTRSSTG